MPLHPLIQIALQSTDIAEFNSALINYEECAYVERHLGASETECSHISKEAFTKALANAQFNWTEYYRIRTPSADQIAQVLEAISWVNVTGNEGISDPALNFFSLNFTRELTSLDKDTFYTIFKVICKLPLEEQSVLPIWQQLTPYEVGKLYRSPFIKTLPEHSPLKTHPVYLELVQLLRHGTQPTLFTPLDMPFMLRKKTAASKKFIMAYLTGNAIVTQASKDNYEVLVPFTLECILNNTITSDRVRALLSGTRYASLFGDNKNQISRILKEPAPARILQAGLPEFIFTYIETATYLEQKLLLEHFDISTFMQSSNEVLKNLSRDHSQKVKTIVSFFLAHYQDHDLTKQLIGAISTHQYPLYYVHLPVFDRFRAAEAITSQVHQLTVHCLEHIISLKPELMRLAWYWPIPQDSRQRILAAYNQSKYRVPLRWLRDVNSTPLIIEALNAYTSLNNHPKNKRLLAYSYAVRQINLAALFPNYSLEAEIINKLSTSSALKT